jgi:hypothetical protein
MCQVKIFPNNTAISVHYCTSFATAIQPTTQVQLALVRVKAPFSDTIFTRSIIQYTIFKLGLIAFISLQLTLPVLVRNVTKILAASSYHFYISLIDFDASLVSYLSALCPFQDISIFVADFIF